MGFNIGIRIIDEFLAKSGVTSCSNFKETAETISKVILSIKFNTLENKNYYVINQVAFKMFLGISVEVSNWNVEGKSFR